MPTSQLTPWARGNPGVSGGANLYAFALNRPSDVWDPFGLTPQSTPATDQMPDGTPKPCLGADCEDRDGRTRDWRLDTFDPRTDRQKIEDTLNEQIRGGCGETMSCSGLPNATASNVLTAAGDQADLDERRDTALREVLRRDSVQSTPDPLDLVPAGGVLKAGRALKSLAVAEDATTIPRGTTLFHGTTVSGARSIMAEGVQPVSIHTHAFPRGSFFTFAGDESSHVAASHWAARSSGVTGEAGVVLRGTLPASIERSLMERGLVVTKSVPGLPFFPPETVFLPEALPVINQSVIWRVVSPIY